LSASKSTNPWGEFFCERKSGYDQTYFAKRTEKTRPSFKNGLKLRILAPGTRPARSLVAAREAADVNHSIQWVVPTMLITVPKGEA
jgi:hypothetical protein